MRIQFRLKLREVLHARGMTQKELAAATGLREATISDLVNDSRNTYNKEHLARCMVALGLTDINDVLETVVSEERAPQ